MTYTVTLPEDPNARPSASGAGCDLELRAPSDLLVRADALRLGVLARVHQDLHAGLRRERPRRHQPDGARLHRQAPRATRSWSCSSTGLDTCPQFEGFGCAATQYCAAMTIDSRTHDQNTGREHRRLQQLHPRRAGADQLGVHHEERRLPGAGEPAVHRDLLRPEPRRGESRTTPRIS